MTDKDNVNRLLEKVDILFRKQEMFVREIEALQQEIYKIKVSQPQQSIMPEAEILADEPVKKEIISEETKPKNPIYVRPQETSQKADPVITFDWEKFVGENIINKIGIAITVIGVAIGAKYSIENELISPLTRIILGYIMGLGLLGFGIKLKEKYENYSAVLVSGAISIMYFITYAAYGFYDLFPQEMAFLLMVIFTVFTVIAAINYNRQVIAHIGLVGAYAVPFLLSEGSGKVAILFTYMAIINIGILAIAFKKFWKPLYYSSFSLTWLIFLSWYLINYEPSNHFGLALLFSAIFFSIFYAMFIAYKLLRKEEFDAYDVVLLLLNSFIFYGLGYSILESHATGEQLLGVFTVGNAIVHFAVASVFYKQKLADRNLFYLVAGLVLVFITIAVPVQLDGNWVTLLWTGEATLLFWIGRTKQIVIYEKLSYPLMLLAFISILHDWSEVYGGYVPTAPETRILPLLNIHFFTSFLFIAAFGFINFINRDKNHAHPFTKDTGLFNLISFLLPAIFLFTLYSSLRIEIANFWDQQFEDSMVGVNDQAFYNYDLQSFKSIWLINYTLLFLTILSFINIRKLKSPQLRSINLALNVLAIGVFLFLGLYELSELRDTYLNPSAYFYSGFFNLVIRYISLAFFAALIFATFKYIQQDFHDMDFRIPFDILLFASIGWILSSELINLLDLAGSTQAYKLGLSILWGVNSLILIAFGIWKNKKHLRLGAIALFSITLLKLFFYDISHLNTISKTIVFVSLGILLLIISFLYNKYKFLIADETNVQN
ncbi:MAG TPA: DUF2339 domain-containing protein [Cytophagales bacterium]|nr:DUF2339 domain-containing protein [Cytophagales bacterium]